MSLMACWLQQKVAQVCDAPKILATVCREGQYTSFGVLCKQFWTATVCNGCGLKVLCTHTCCGMLSCKADRHRQYQAALFHCACGCLCIIIWAKLVALAAQQPSAGTASHVSADFYWLVYNSTFPLRLPQNHPHELCAYVMY